MRFRELPDPINQFHDVEPKSSGTRFWKISSSCRRRANAARWLGISSKLALDAAIDELKAAIGHTSLMKKLSRKGANLQRSLIDHKAHEDHDVSFVSLVPFAV